SAERAAAIVTSDRRKSAGIARLLRSLQGASTSPETMVLKRPNLIFSTTTIAAAKARVQPWSSPAFVHLATAEGEGSDALRSQIESWCANLPVKEWKDLVARFTSDDDRSHLSAYFELMFHQFFLE